MKRQCCLWVWLYNDDDATYC